MLKCHRTSFNVTELHSTSLNFIQRHCEMLFIVNLWSGNYFKPKQPTSVGNGMFYTNSSVCRSIYFAISLFTTFVEIIWEKFQITWCVIYFLSHWYVGNATTRKIQTDLRSKVSVSFIYISGSCISYTMLL